jgi:hypothetical protein
VNLPYGFFLEMFVKKRKTRPPVEAGSFLSVRGPYLFSSTKTSRSPGVKKKKEYQLVRTRFIVPASYPILKNPSMI